MCTAGNDYDIVSVTHMMEPADYSIIEDCLMSHTITVMKERIPSLLIIGYHALTDPFHQQTVPLVLGLSIHLLPL